MVIPVLVNNLDTLIAVGLTAWTFYKVGRWRERKYGRHLFRKD